jgi:hypothetical protein
MANPIVKVNTSGISKRIQAYKANLRQKLVDEMPTVGKAVLDDVAQRTPSPDEEYYSLMGVRSMTGMISILKNKGFGVSRAMIYGMKTNFHDVANATIRGRTHRIGIGNPGSGTYHGTRMLRTPPTAHGPGWSYSSMSGTRIHFLRAPGMWLKEVVYDTRTYSVDSQNLRVRAGNTIALEELTKFSWQNFSYRKGEFLHTSEYGVWRWFEYGKTATVSPRYWGGQPYLLRPNDNPNDAFLFMNKSYPRFNMYTGFNKVRIQPLVVSIARSVKF